MDNQLEAACEYIRHHPNVKLTSVARQFQVTRDRLRTRVEGGSGKRGPKLATTKLLAAEESAICRYVDHLDKINLAVQSEFITDAANYVLSQRSSSLETAHTVGKNWTTRFIRRHNYKKAHQKTLNSEIEASRGLRRDSKLFNRLKVFKRDEFFIPNYVWNIETTSFCKETA